MVDAYNRISRFRRDFFTTLTESALFLLRKWKHIRSTSSSERRKPGKFTKQSTKSIIGSQAKRDFLPPLIRSIATF